MSHDLSLAQNHAFDLARTLMIPVTLFRVDGEYGVMPSEDLDDAEVELIHEYDPWVSRPAH
ncbi:hypothetical protein [Neoaquamicrobium sediminum]|uniref:hypothetical protein n=1 Tax=Neoaquamicrobium sediminum TaxID=1849104 RepID=UPI0015631DB2|nr:hypothetical protein [Mesorhizobium sediminum]NRC56536.1 hypothetical protein [Mesorhizobium sediminum]